ncbi:hypothetical protein ACFO3O_09200 [Dokdonia ponticola]|uniref:DUF4843 domain-containing protein n=1 Tax=Dokdonia ponticola TaxID=2041041 RepID=A0ABV9HV94_9FLAO
MKKILIYILFGGLISCTSEIDFGDLLSIRDSRDFITADNADTVTFVLEFNEDAEVELINAKATVINGAFQENNEDELDINPIKDINGKIGATVVLQSTTVVSDVKVEFNINEFITPFIITAIPSEPASISLQASAFNVDNNFDSEITLTGNLKNELGNKVSNGFSVRFEDTFENGTLVGGSYRESSLVSSNGLISTIYSPGPVTANQYINLEVIVLDENSNDTDITETIQIFITTE